MNCTDLLVARCKVIFVPTAAPGQGNNRCRPLLVCTRLQSLTAVPTVDMGTRIGAFLIDVVPMLVLSFVVGWIPIIGFVIMGIVGAAYWLLRDFNGASIGKMVLGLVVVKKDGFTFRHQGPDPAENVTLAIGPALMIIPLIGMFLSPITGIITLMEVIMLFVKHERLGDMLANTTVVKRPV